LIVDPVGFLIGVLVIRVLLDPIERNGSSHRNCQENCVLLHDHGGKVPAVRVGPTIGLVAQFCVLAMIAILVDLGVAGWASGIAYGFVTFVGLTRGLERVGDDAFGPADWVTLARAMLVGAVTALVVASFVTSVPVTMLVTIAAVAVVLDAVDGWVARRTGTVDGLGARFDMEVDSFLLLVLSAYLARSVGAWVLAIGGMRYAFVVAGWVMPWMRGQLPPRFWRKVVAATQAVVLVVAAADVLPAWLTVTVLVISLALLVESFGRDVAWLWVHRAVGSRL
jgi:phosphatidylglycerophosphate synthase